MKRIKLIVNPHRNNSQAPEKIYANKEMDELRRKYCLCLNCAELKACEVAKKLYDICIENNTAMIMTRCGVVNEKGDLKYKPK